MKHLLRTLALPAALAVTLTLAACGNSTSPGGHNMPDRSGTMPSSTAASGTPTTTGTPGTGTKNAADVAFATGMIPHHAQAVVMADMALKQGTDAKILALAPKVKAAQSPEIARMSGWLTGWGAPLPDTTGGHDMSMDSNDGMMSAQEMTDLGSAKGSTFDRMWLHMMTRHHQGAVALAKTELTNGASTEGKQLAQSIIDSQSAEISEMKSILAGVTG